MSFAGFVFDMIRRDKENRNLRASSPGTSQRAFG